MKKLFFLIVFTSAFVLTGIGLFSGQNQIMLAKAVNICLECIGIG